MVSNTEEETMACLFDNFLFRKYFRNAQKSEELQNNVKDDILKLEKENLKDSQELNLAQIAQNLKFEVKNLKPLRNLIESLQNLYNEKVSEVTQNSILKLEGQNQIAQDHNEKLKIENQDLFFTFKKLTQSRIKILEVAQDRRKKLEIENLKFNVRQINFLKAEMERMISNFEKMNQSAQDRIKILEVENQNLMKSWKNAQKRNLKLSRELQNEKDLRICKICMNEEISHVFLPCGHAICCKNCINNIQKCPNCRKNVCNSVMLYF